MSAQEKNDIKIDVSTKTLCIVQLARIGDLIQTYIAAKSIKKNENTKNFRLILVARKRFADPIRFLLQECFDDIITLDYERIVTSVDETVDKSIFQVNDLLKNINKTTIHALVNLTYSRTSAYISSLIKANFKLGVCYDNTHNLIIKDHWSQYVYSNVLTGPLNPFSLVDVFSKIIGTPAPLAITSEKKKNIKNIVIHPFTSQERKHWKASKWSEILFNIFKTNSNVTVHFVGSDKDIKGIDEIISSPLIQKYQGSIQNRAGKTSIAEVFELLKQSELFIGHDSMVGHLASLTKIKSITISLGSVRPIESTPYAQNNYVVAPLTNCFPCFPDQKCDHFKCHSDIPYQAINTFISNILQAKDENKLTEGLSPFHISNVQFYKTNINKSGFFELLPMIEHNLDLKHVFQKIYRIAWTFILAEKDENSTIPVINQTTAAQLLNYREGIKSLYQISEFGKKYSTYILQEVASSTPSVTKIKEYSKKIEDVDKLQLTIKEAYPLLAPIIDYYAIVKANLCGDNIVNITENAYISYENCSLYCNVIHELIEKTAGDFKQTVKSERPARG